MPVTLYLGEPQCGKTTLMRDHVTALAQSCPEIVVLIVNHGEKPGRPSWRDIPVDHRVYHSTGEWWAEPSRVAIFEGVSGIEVAQLAIDVGWSFYVDDEADGIVSDGAWGRSEAAAENPLRDIVKRGAHLANRAGEITEVHAFLATHRPANLPTDVSGLYTNVYIGRFQGWIDAERIRKEGWINARSTDDALEQLKALPKGGFIACVR